MSDYNTPSILYMEDDEGLARLFKKKIEKEGYKVDIASNGRIGLEMIDANPYHIIALDNQMPEYNGIDVLKILKDRESEHPPVIMITGTGSEEIAIQAMKLGASDYIIKDVENRYFELLPSLLEKVLEKKRLIEEKKRAEEALRKKNLIMEQELQIAQTVQQAFVKHNIPPSDFCNIDYRYKPMYSVGGDYFSVLPHGDKGMGIFICDVSGHGVASALFLALIKNVSDRIFLQCGDRPAEYLRRLNNELCGYLMSYFITGIYGLVQFPLEADHTSFIFSNGGHPQPIVIRKEGRAEVVGSSNILMGVYENADYIEMTVNLRKGDRLFLYTDGIPETTNRGGEIIGYDEKLCELFQGSFRSSLADTLDEIMNKVEQFNGNQALSDDVVLIGVEIA